MNEYTPEKVAELIAEARAEGADWRENIGAMPLFDRLADALTAVSAERDRLHKAITEALAIPRSGIGPESTEDEVAQGEGWNDALRDVERILRAALEQKGNDDDR